MSVSYSTDGGIGTKANFGLIVLQSDETVEYEINRYLSGDQIGLYHTRIPMVPHINAQSLIGMINDLPHVVSLLPPAVSFNVVGYACTSASTVLGSIAVANAIQTIMPNTKVTDPIDSLLAACAALSAKRICFLSPYIDEVSKRMRQAFENADIEIANYDSFEQSDDQIVSRISPDSILRAIEKITNGVDCDLVVVSCTALRTAEILSDAASRLGKPVLSSNSAMAWNMARLARMPELADRIILNSIPRINTIDGKGPLSEMM